MSDYTKPSLPPFIDQAAQAGTDHTLPPDSGREAVQPIGDGKRQDEPSLVPPPSVTARRLTVPRARREIKQHLVLTNAALRALTRLELGETVALCRIAIDALVCGATDTPYPLDDDRSDIARLRSHAAEGRLKAYVGLAKDEVEDVLAVLEASLVALKAVSLLDEPLPAEWGNLDGVSLARRLNLLGHTLLRGRIAGVNL